jgi:hypothetical protein
MASAQGSARPVQMIVFTWSADMMLLRIISAKRVCHIRPCTAARGHVEDVAAERLEGTPISTPMPRCAPSHRPGAGSGAPPGAANGGRMMLASDRQLRYVQHRSVLMEAYLGKSVTPSRTKLLLIPAFLS